MRRSTFRPAIEAASSTARRCCSVKKPGMESTASVILAPWSFSPMAFSSDMSAASSCSARKAFSSPMYCTRTTGTPPAPSVTVKLKVGASETSSESPVRLPSRRFSCPMVFLGSMLIFSPAATPMKRCGTRGAGKARSAASVASRGRASAHRARACRRYDRLSRPHTCLAAKFTMDGVSRLLSLFSTTSMPLRLASATTDVALPTSIPSTDMAADGAAWNSREICSADRSAQQQPSLSRRFAAAAACARPRAQHAQHDAAPRVSRGRHAAPRATRGMAPPQRTAVRVAASALAEAPLECVAVAPGGERVFAGTAAGTLLVYAPSAGAGGGSAAGGGAAAAAATDVTALRLVARRSLSRKPLEVRRQRTRA
jgi:hypothetical protein